MPVCEAASISITSTWRPSMIAGQCSPSSRIDRDGPAIDGIGLVVEGPRQDARRGGLADTANAGQHVGLGDAAGRRRRSVSVRTIGVLADEVGRTLRAVFARQHAVGLPAWLRRRRVARPWSGLSRTAFALGSQASGTRTSVDKRAATKRKTAHGRHGRDVAHGEEGGRLAQATRETWNSLGLLPSGPDPVGEWLVHHQPPDRDIVWAATKSKSHRRKNAVRLSKW